MQELATLAPRPASAGRSVRYRLLVIALLPMLVILPLLLAASLYRWNTEFDATLRSKVNDDLTIAHQYFARLLGVAQEELVATAASARFQDALREGDYANGDLSALLKQIAGQHGLDFLYVVNADGRIIASGYPLASKTLRWNWPVIRSALDGHARTAIDTAKD